MTAEQDLAAATARLAASVSAEAAAPRFVVQVAAAQRAVFAYDVPAQANGSYELGPPGTVAMVAQVFVAGVLQALSAYAVHDGAVVPVVAFTGSVDLFGWAL